MVRSIRYRGDEFVYYKEIANDYDFEIALETIRNNHRNIIHRDKSTSKP